MLRVRARFATAAVAVLALLSGPPLAAQQPAVTLERLLSAPFPEELLASPAGAKLAWIDNAQGVRNVWVAEPPDYRGRQVTRYTADDGQAIGSLEWTPDARSLIYVRGGGPNRAGGGPQSDERPGGRRAGDLAGLARRRRRRCGSAPAAGSAVSPKGDGIAYTRRGEIFWAARVERREAGKAGRPPSPG